MFPTWQLGIYRPGDQPRMSYQASSFTMKERSGSTTRHSTIRLGKFLCQSGYLWNHPWQELDADCIRCCPIAAPTTLANFSIYKKMRLAARNLDSILGTFTKKFSVTTKK